MKYSSGAAFLAADSKRICLTGMSGVGKTHLSNLMRGDGWYHYSVDYRLGTRYLGEQIVDEVRKSAMRVPQLAAMLRSSAIQIDVRLAMGQLDALSAYVGKPGDETRGWLPVAEFLRRQELHAQAEKSAMLDLREFIDKARDVYRCSDFVCDASGSFCSIVDPDDPADPILLEVSESCAIVHIEAEETQLDMLIEAFKLSPKPIFYSEAFFWPLFTEYLSMSGERPETFNGDSFAQWAFQRLVGLRAPRYRAIADRWGYSVSAKDARKVSTNRAFMLLIAEAIDKQNARQRRLEMNFDQHSPAPI